MSERYLDDTVPVFLEDEDTTDYCYLKDREAWLYWTKGHRGHGAMDPEPSRYPCFATVEVSEDSQSRDWYTYHFVYPVLIKPDEDPLEQVMERMMNEPRDFEADGDGEFAADLAALIEGLAINMKNLRDLQNDYAELEVRYENTVRDLNAKAQQLSDMSLKYANECLARKHAEENARTAETRAKVATKEWHEGVVRRLATALYGIAPNALTMILTDCGLTVKEVLKDE